ncbi:MAG: suppressor of fused domain protein [Planctomycetes bacterium]|nr:suppressor of fused domain protein [Planctomycetota bacterium]
MDLAEYRRRYEGKDATPGWDAINARLEQVYGAQEPKHWGTLIKHMLGGPDPLDGISAFECRDGGKSHLHFVTYGYSSLYYDEEAAGGEFSRYGLEMTFRLASELPPAEQPLWVCNLLQNLARYVFKSGRWFEPYHWIPTNSPIRADFDTDLVGLAFLLDPVLGGIDTPHGRVEFIQAFGITKQELESFKDTKQTAEALIDARRKSNPLLVTDLARKDG